MSIVNLAHPHVTPIAGQTLTLTGGAGGTNASTAFTNWKTDNAAAISADGKFEINGKDADIIVNGQSLKETLKAINSRLAVLQPDPKLLAKYEALQQAYEHYLTLEALLHENDDK